MNIAWFHKVLYSSPAWLPDGRKAQFESVGDDEGVVAISSEESAMLYRALAQKGVGGVIEITQAEYEELKKKPVIEQRRSPAQGPLQASVHPLSRILQPPGQTASAQAPVAAGEPAPPPAPKAEIVQPKVRKPPPRKSS